MSKENATQLQGLGLRLSSLWRARSVLVVMVKIMFYCEIAIEGHDACVALDWWLGRTSATRQRPR